MPIHCWENDQFRFFQLLGNRGEIIAVSRTPALQGQTHMKNESLRTLLQRAAAAIETPGDLTPDELRQVAADLLNCKSPDAHPLIGQSFPVLDQGFVKLVRFMGGDAEIVEAARLTAQSEGKGDDRNLLRFLMRHNHSTPIEFFEIVLHVRCPMDVWRQWIRHRTANVNEYSTRYTAAIDACQQTLPEQWRMQSTSNRQGSAGVLDGAWPPGYTFDAATGRVFLPVDTKMQMVDGYDEIDGVHRAYISVRGETNTLGGYLTDREQDVHVVCREAYEERLALGVAKEQARKDLPLSNYTEAYWKIDGGNLINFLRLRMDGHAQKEIRDYATVIGEQILSQLCPNLWEAFNDYVFHAMKLTRLDIVVINNLLHLRQFLGDQATTEDFMAAQYEDWKPLEKCRERDECLAKLQKLGLVQTP